MIMNIGMILFSLEGLMDKLFLEIIWKMLETEMTSLFQHVQHAGKSTLIVKRSILMHIFMGMLFTLVRRTWAVDRKGGKALMVTGRRS